MSDGTWRGSITDGKYLHGQWSSNERCTIWAPSSEEKASKLAAEVEIEGDSQSITLAVTHGPKVSLEIDENGDFIVYFSSKGQKNVRFMADGIDEKEFGDFIECEISPTTAAMEKYRKWWTDRGEKSPY